jgi:hypothetical protein
MCTRLLPRHRWRRSAADACARRRCALEPGALGAGVLSLGLMPALVRALGDPDTEALGADSAAAPEAGPRAVPLELLWLAMDQSKECRKARQHLRPRVGKCGARGAARARRGARRG